MPKSNGFADGSCKGEIYCKGVSEEDEEIYGGVPGADTDLRKPVSAAGPV